jgi:predicted phosphodiesterase
MALRLQPQGLFFDLLPSRISLTAGRTRIDETPWTNVSLSLVNSLSLFYIPRFFAHCSHSAQFDLGILPSFIYTHLRDLKSRMRLLVLSDLHANLTALEASLSAAEGKWDRVVCLGDVVGYGPDPNEVTSCIRQLGAITIRGNHDKAVAGIMPTDDFNPVAKMAVHWTRAQLNPENLEWITLLPRGPREAEGVVLIHGAFQDEDEYVFTPSQALEGLLDSYLPVTFYGHTHHQGGFSYIDPQLDVLQLHPRQTEKLTALRIEPEKRYLLNPGSIGQPRDGDPRAGFAIADLSNDTVEFWRVPYDIEKVQERMRGARLPEPLSQRLSVGR